MSNFQTFISYFNIKLTDYKICTGIPWGEDKNCSHSVPIQVNAQGWNDHRNYFGTTSVPNYCPKFDEQLYPPNGRVPNDQIGKIKLTPRDENGNEIESSNSSESSKKFHKQTALGQLEAAMPFVGKPNNHQRHPCFRGICFQKQIPLKHGCL